MASNPSMLALCVLAAMLCCGSAIDPRYAMNITVYHVNPDTYPAAPTNMNTADLRGDIFFDIRSICSPYECAADPDNHDCDNPEVTSKDLVITKLILEVDSRFGQYALCNICENHTDYHGNDNCTNGQYVCECGPFGHPIPCTPPVGMVNITQMFGNATHGGPFSCNKFAANYTCWRENAANKLGGLWYSTLVEGACNATSGPDCTWRLVEVVKRVNKTCSDNVIYSTVEAQNQPCFAGCGARNTTSPCWINCFYDTVLGPEAAYSPTFSGIPVSDLLNAWDMPFASEDPSQGGCPSMPY